MQLDISAAEDFSEKFDLIRSSRGEPEDRYEQKEGDDKGTEEDQIHDKDVGVVLGVVVLKQIRRTSVVRQRVGGGRFGAVLLHTLDNLGF